MTAMHRYRIAAAALAAATGACSDPAATGAGRALEAPEVLVAEVEHATAVRGGYTLTVYPGWARVARLRSGGGQVELYRNDGVYGLPRGQRAPSGRHEIRFRGGPEGRDVAVVVQDPGHAVAAIRLHLRRPGAEGAAGPGTLRDGEGGDTLDVENIIRICPPDCTASPSQVPGRRMVEVPVRIGGAQPADHHIVRSGGYELTLHPGLTGRAEIRALDGTPRELYRRHGVVRVPGGGDARAPGHVLALRGGPYARDLALRLDDPRREVAAVVLELHAPGYVPGFGRAAPPVETLVVRGEP